MSVHCHTGSSPDRQGALSGHFRCLKHVSLSGGVFPVVAVFALVLSMALPVSSAYAQENRNAIVQNDPDTNRQLTDTQFAVHGTRGVIDAEIASPTDFQNIPSSIGVWEICVGMSQSSHDSIADPSILPGNTCLLYTSPSPRDS